MTYTKREDVILEGWTVVELASGELVAVRCDKKRVERDGLQAISYCTQAKVVDALGAEVPDAAGKAMTTGFTFSAALGEVETHGDANITRDLLLYALGEEPQGVVTLSERNKAETSIRKAIEAAQLVGTADAGAVL